ncbi:MAG: hypothetical protein IPH77_12775 [Ignavibacteria bacterium]|nr:hypothetical protein [Ignavibacteria bacterium]
MKYKIKIQLPAQSVISIPDYLQTGIGKRDLNKADWDAANQMGYIWRTDNNPGTSVGCRLFHQLIPLAGAWQDNTVAGNPWGIYDGFTDQENSLHFLQESAERKPVLLQEEMK